MELGGKFGKLWQRLLGGGYQEPTATPPLPVRRSNQRKGIARDLPPGRSTPPTCRQSGRAAADGGRPGRRARRGWVAGAGSIRTSSDGGFCRALGQRQPQVTRFRPALPGQLARRAKSTGACAQRRRDVSRPADETDGHRGQTDEDGQVPRRIGFSRKRGFIGWIRTRSASPQAESGRCCRAEHDAVQYKGVARFACFMCQV
jgi:hypothetical protein